MGGTLGFFLFTMGLAEIEGEGGSGARVSAFLWEMVGRGQSEGLGSSLAWGGERVGKRSICWSAMSLRKMCL